jgi:hypothetical protein
MKRGAKILSIGAMASALILEPIVGELSSTLAEAQPHGEQDPIPTGEPTTCVHTFASGAAVSTLAGAFYAVLVPAYITVDDAAHKSLVISIIGTPVAGRYFSLDKAMSLLGKFVPRYQLRSLRLFLAAGKPQVVGGQRKSTTTSTPPQPTTPTTPAQATPTEQANAHEVVMRFLQGIKIAALPEGKQLLADSQWVLGTADRGKNFYSRPNYTEVNSVFASLFDTDVPNVKGYKELFDMKAQTQGGTTANVKYFVIAFKDVAAGKWKVLGSFDDLGDESAIDIGHQVTYFKDHLTDTRYESLRENYASYGHWLLLEGRIAEARMAFTTAKTSPDTTDNPVLGVRHDNDSIRDLQIDAQLMIIGRITASPKTSP